jgi:hypothetical protein
VTQPTAAAGAREPRLCRAAADVEGTGGGDAAPSSLKASRPTQIELPDSVSADELASLIEEARASIAEAMADPHLQSTSARLFLGAIAANLAVQDALARRMEAALRNVRSPVTDEERAEMRAEIAGAAAAALPTAEERSAFVAQVVGAVWSRCAA